MRAAAPPWGRSWTSRRARLPLAEFIDGTVAPAPVEGGYNLLLTIQGEGLVNEEGWFLNRVYSLGVNASRTYYSKYAEFTTTVTAIL